jgi:hypothetical protein
MDRNPSVAADSFLTNDDMLRSVVYRVFEESGNIASNVTAISGI